jgi:DNA polymerase III subunit alpha
LNDNFCHLHAHSEYSSLDGFGQIKKIVQKVKELGQPAIAITDHGNLNGAYKFYKECKENKIKPILGNEVYIVEDYKKEAYSSKKLYHLVILAKNKDGWENLLKLHKISYSNFYYKPRIDINDLILHKEGLIILSGCQGGILSKNILNRELKKAEELLRILSKEFNDDFYIELMDHGLETQKELNHILISLSKKYNIKTVVTNDCHYVEKDDSIYQDYLLCDQLKTTIHEERKIKFETNEFYIKSRKEMPFGDKEKDTTLEIADKCNVEIKFKRFLLPRIMNQEEKIIKLISEGIKKRNIPDSYLERLREEYRVIKEANLIGYFLTVHDYIKYAKDNGILVGPGRGSVGGCLLGYVLEIHDIDPIKHKLLFSRFYNEGRKKSLPDIDIDFPENKINIIREYVKEKYGKERVSHIGTYTYLHPKSSLKLVCRVLGVDFKTANEYSRIIEDEKATEDLKKTSESFKDIEHKSREFENLAMHSSIHAAGIIISPTNLENIIPLRINKETDTYVSNWDMKDIEAIGLVKYDFLSLNTLDVIQDTLDAANIKIEDISHEDAETFKTINTTKNVGLFQLSSDGISKIANEIAVSSIDDIAIIVALYRPGPIQCGLHTEYINRKNGAKDVEYDHPLLEKVLDDTYGVFVYQEQLIKAVMILANFSETDADLLRKAMGKKIESLMAEQEEKFINGCKENKIKESTIKLIWNKIKESASYNFNKSHAVSYAYITYYTAYLKTHYPCEFMAALLNNNHSKSDKLATYLKECKNLGIKVVPPSVVNGDYSFIAKNNTIIFGIKGIGGIGSKTAEKMFENKYDSFESFCYKFKPSSDVLVALSESGAFDEFGYKRNQIIQYSKAISDQIKKNRKNTNPKAKTLFKKELTLNIPDIEELPEEILASKEYSRLNVYLVYNPLNGGELETPEKLEGEIFIEGYLTDIKEHLTKKKKTMAFLSISTNLGQIEALMFPKTYTNNKYIRKNTYIAIEGRYEDKLLIKNIWEKKNVNR